MGDTTTTTKNEIPPPTPEEKAMMGMVADALMPAELEAQGWHVNKTEGTYEDTPQSKQFIQRRADLNQQKQDLQTKLDTLGQSVGRYNTENQVSVVQQQISQINNKLDQVDNDENKFRDKYQPEVSYNLEKKWSEEAEQARNAYGVDSQQYKDAVTKAQDQAITQEKTDNQITQKFQATTLKFLNGDFSVTPEQKQLIAENNAPIKAALDKMFTGEFETNEKTFSDFRNQVNQTGMNINAALDTVGNQIIKTGNDMTEALGRVVETNKALMKMGIEDYTGEVTKKIATSAASIGRSPDDPEYVSEMQNQVARQVQEGTLNLASMEAQGQLQIKGQTGADMEQLLLQKASVAERTGGQLEQAALNEGQNKLAIQDAQGNANVNLENQAANLRWQVGAGMPPQQIQTGMGVSEYSNALNQQRIANAQNAAQAPMPYLQMGQQERAYNSTQTVTQHTPLGMQIMGGVLGAAGAAANIYSGASSASTMRGFASKLGG